MKKFKNVGLGALGSVLIAFVPVSTLAMATPISATNSSATANAINQTRINNLKTRGAAEITRRLNTLNKLSGLIGGAQNLSSTDKSSLTSQVSGEITGLTALRAKLTTDTDLPTAQGDVQSIYNEYRVYALLVPKVNLLITSDRELTNDDKLTTLATKLQTRITTAKTSGKDVSSLQSSLDNMNTNITDAKNLANAVNAKVAPLQPSDYNTEHTILSGQRDQLKTAHQDNVSAYNDAQSIVNGLK